MQRNVVLHIMMEVEVGGNMVIKAEGFKLNLFGCRVGIKLKERLEVL